MTQTTESELREKYLDLLSQQFDSPEKLATEIVNLESILELPKVLNTLSVTFMVNMNRSNMYYVMGLVMFVQNKRPLCKDIVSKEIDDLAALVYYPEEKLKLVKNNFDSKGKLNVWYITTIEQLIDLITYCSSKYTRSKLRKALPKEYTYIVEELLYKNNEFNNKNHTMKHS